ncbi:hypothetical protein [Stenotrophomonas sp.]|uniref:hypothetical protein n=1 Tax=Stenotrophomonas sp. TaxID=69392 RepID=UPI002FCC74EE
MSEPASARRPWLRRLGYALDAWLAHAVNQRELGLAQWVLVVSLIGCGLWVEVDRRLPPVAFLVVDTLIYLGIFSFITNVAMLVLMFRRRDRHSDRFKAATGVLLIVCASLLYTGLEGAYARTSYLLTTPSIPYWLPVVINHLVTLKYLFGFGFAAIGAGVVSGIISRERSGAPPA